MRFPGQRTCLRIMKPFAVGLGIVVVQAIATYIMAQCRQLPGNFVEPAETVRDDVVAGVAALAKEGDLQGLIPYEGIASPP